MAAKMLKGYHYSLVIPHSALLHKVLGDLCVMYGDAKRTYGLWSMVTGRLGLYFL